MKTNIIVHILLIVVLFTGFTQNSQAQEIQYKRNEISINEGIIPISGLWGGVVSFSGQYFYQKSNKTALGGILSVSLGNIDNSAISLLGAWRHSWIYKKKFNLYTKLALGIANNIDKGDTAIAFQVSPIGMTFGSRLFGTFELGIGAQGFLVLGIGYTL